MFIRPSALCSIATIFSQLSPSGFSASTGSLEAKHESRQESSSFTSTSTTSVTIVEYTEAWGSVSSAFSTCQSTFESGVSVQVAVEAVQKLYAHVQTVITKYGTCNSCAVHEHAEYVDKYKEIVASCYKSWGKIIQAGQRNYTTQWKSQIAPAFQPFDIFVKTTKSACSAFRIDLGGLLGGIGLSLNLFLSININLGSILNLSFGNGGFNL